MAINATYVDAIKASTSLDVAAYSPLSGLSEFNDLLVELDWIDVLFLNIQTQESHKRHANSSKQHQEHE